mmetsp:Transcript_12467/g.20272  ORF Transcript_12467/g.20272 Transcript_12467/m.20272 type:complete len:280 (+) Transcript_12467:6807-7646(+)
MERESRRVDHEQEQGRGPLLPSVALSGCGRASKSESIRSLVGSNMRRSHTFWPIPCSTDKRSNSWSKYCCFDKIVVGKKHSSSKLLLSPPCWSMSIPLPEPLEPFRGSPLTAGASSLFILLVAWTVCLSPILDSASVLNSSFNSFPEAINRIIDGGVIPERSETFCLKEPIVSFAYKGTSNLPPETTCTETVIRLPRALAPCLRATPARALPAIFTSKSSKITLSRVRHRSTFCSHNAALAPVRLALAGPAASASSRIHRTTNSCRVAPARGFRSVERF